MAKKQLEPTEWERLEYLLAKDPKRAIHMYEHHQRVIAMQTSRPDAETSSNWERIAHLHVAPPESETNQKIRLLGALGQIARHSPVTKEQVETVRDSPWKLKFSRYRPDTTAGMNIHDRGRLMEAVYAWKNGKANFDLVVRLFTHRFNDKARKKTAEDGQRFYYALAEYAAARYQDPSNEFEEHLHGKISRLRAINPVSSTRTTIDNIFLDQEVGRELLERCPIERRIEVTRQISDIDLIMAYLSREYRQTTEGRKLYHSKNWIGRRTRPNFKTRDERSDIVFDMLAAVDTQFRDVLQERNILDEHGKLAVKDDSMLEVFYSADSEQGKVLELLDARQTTQQEQVLTPDDLHSRNFLMNRKAKTYTVLDFDCTQEDSLMSILFKRWISTGVYEHREKQYDFEQDRKTESELLHNSYSTYCALEQTHDRQPMPFERFEKEFYREKKRQLLRLARRYKLFQQTTSKEKEKMAKLSNYYFSLLAEQLVHEGKIESYEDPKLDYLTSLFGKPLSGTSLAQEFQEATPHFATLSTVSPFEPTDLEAKVIQDATEHADRYLQQARDRNLRIKLGVGAIILAINGLIGTAINQYWSYAKIRDQKQVEEIKHEYQKQLTRISLVLRGAEAYDNEEIWIKELLPRLAKKIPDSATRYAIVFDKSATFDAIAHSGGRTDYKSIKPYLKENHPELVDAVKQAMAIEWTTANRR